MYSVVTDEQAKPQVDALPTEALAAYAELRVALEKDPWAGQPYNRNNPEGALRIRSFATYGQVV